MKSERSGKVFLLAVAFLVAALLALGMVLVRSPSEMQQVRLDERRVSDLRELNRAVHQYYRRQGKLPESLAQLPMANPPRGAMTDPLSGEAYAYQVLGERDFNLCARFELSDRTGENSYPHFYDTDLGVDWRHDAGPFCYTLAVRERETE